MKMEAKMEMVTLILNLHWFQGILQVERKLGGRLLDTPKQILFQFGGGNLCMSIEEFGPGWRCKLAANYQVTRDCLSLSY